MSLILSGTNGLSDVDGSAATPAIRGTDANTGIFFPTADTIAFSEGGTEVMRIDSSGNLGIGTSSPTAKLQVYNNINGTPFAWGNATRTGYLYQDASGVGITNASGTGFDEGVYLDTANSATLFYTNSTERARIDSSGNLLVNKTAVSGSKFEVAAAAEVASFQNTGGTGTVRFYNSAASTIGYIQWSGSTTSYVTSSDYRLKEAIAPMTGALAKVALLKPCTYKWKVDGSDGQGFIAHELQAVVPGCVTGEKDAVDADGKPQYQGIDTSFLVATLTAAIQELNAKVTALENK